jgi:hypothetical protein
MSSATQTHDGEATFTRHVLVEEASLGLYRENAFRITGLPVEASAKEIAKHLDKLKMMEELGQGGAAHASWFALNPSPSLDQIKEANRRLTDPQRRLIDEFFWFWPMTIGHSVGDPALQALMRGNPSAAYEIWAAEEAKPDTGFAATHNIAVMCYLLAVEWTLYQIAAGVDSDRAEEILNYWEQALRRWRKITSNELVCDAVTARIRCIDDPRLTIGFGRRMTNSLPDALCKINAEAAIKFAEQGRLEWAKTHVNFMREPHQEVDNFVNTAELALTPARTRLKQQIARAQERAGKNESEALGAGRELLDHASQYNCLFELFFGKEGGHNELSDEIASVCQQLPLAYHKTTRDHRGVLTLYTATLPFAVSPDLKKELQSTILTLMLLEIDDSKLVPKAKLERIRREIVPMLTNGDQSSNSTAGLDDMVARCVRGVGISAHNEHDDLETAMEATGLASNLARDPELKSVLAQDKAQLENNKIVRKQNTLFLQIRGDAIEVTRERVRYNSCILPSNDISGVRFGGQYTNGITTSVSYLVAVNSASHGTIEIECKRFGRSQEMAKSDFEAILNALFYQTIPPLCTRIAKYITAGNRVPLGDCWVTKNGILVTTATLLFGKKENLIPWSELKLGHQSGYTYIGFTQRRSVSKSFSHRGVWNAVILKELADAVVAHQA